MFHPIGVTLPDYPLVFNTASDENVFDAIDWSLKRVGITPTWIINNSVVKPGEYMIFVPLKNQ